MTDTEKINYAEIKKLCEHCEGAGGFSISAHNSAGEIVDEELDPCPQCNGTGLSTECPQSRVSKKVNVC